MRGDIHKVIGMAAGCALGALASMTTTVPVSGPADAPARDSKLALYIEAYVTGYNTVVGQTDETPCIGAAGTNICGRDNVAACPPLLKLGSVVEIGGKRYICEDRTARKYRDRFDINCDQDKSCPYKVAGWTSVKVVLD